MFKRLIGVFLAAAMILSVCPCYTALAATTVTTSGGSVIVYARNATYTTSTFGLTDGYTEKSASSDTTGMYLQAAQGSSSTPSGSKLSFTVTADQAGRYTIWARVKGTSSNGATWFDAGGFGYIRKDLDTGGSWDWVRLSSGVYVASGSTMTVELYPKDDGHCIDEFIVTNKATYLPSGKVTDVSKIKSVTLTASYGSPTIYPPANTHPRVMFKASDIEAITLNATKSQNEAAKTHLDGLVAESLSGTSTSTGRAIENKIEANAFYYAVYGDTAKGNKAVTELINYLNSVRFDSTNKLVSREMGCVVFKAAEVYDWCYPLLSSSQKTLIINNCESIMAGMEIGYPDTAQGNVVGHGSEAQLLRDMLSFGIAVYDERPDIYNHVMGRIQNEMVPARNYWYQSHSVHQGSSYGFYRFYWDLWAQKLVKAMSGRSLFDEENMAQVAYYQLYSHRSDGRLFVQGDDSSLSWQYYNAYNSWGALFAGDLFGDNYLKGEYRRGRAHDDFTNTNYNNDKSFNSVFWLIVNDPSISFNKNRTSLPMSRYFGSPNGVILARIGDWDYYETNAYESNTASAMMKIGEMYAGNHDHLDAGTFQLYYKGILASDSGVYEDYGSDHDANYAKRTIAHNGLLIYDSSESFNVLEVGTANDGGQRWLGEPSTYAIWTNGSYKRGKVIDHEIASNNAYSYIKGDITQAYSSSKASKVVRSMSFLETGNATFPAIMVVYDKVVSKTASQTKTFLLHTQAEPAISGTTTTVVNNNTITYSNGNQSIYNGRMVMNTLLPANPTITKIGGEGSQYKVNGTNYPVSDNNSKYEGGWGRIEIKPSTSDTSTEFLNVMAVSDGDCTDSVSSTLIEGTNLVGTRTLNNVVMFSDQASATNGRVSSGASFTVPGSDTGLKFTIFGLKAGNWIVKRNGSVLTQRVASESGATIAFEGAAGEYELSYGAMSYEPFSSANYARGTVTEVKGNNLSNFKRTHSGSSGTARTSVKMEANTDVTGEQGLINVYDTSNNGYSCRFAHANFKLSSNVGGVQIRIRNGSAGNIQWMNFDTSGKIAANSGNSVDFGLSLPLDGTEHDCDIIADVINGIGYFYIDGKLASKAFNLQTSGKWYGYLIYKLSGTTWSNGDYVKWSNYAHSSYQHTLFNDTNNHVVQWEDVVGNAGLTENTEDPNMILSDSKVSNYFVTQRQNNASSNILSTDSVRLNMQSPDDILAGASLMGGFYHDHISTGEGSNSVYVGGRWLWVSFDQTITGETERTQIRVRAKNTNKFGMGFHPSNGHMAVSVEYDDHSGSEVLSKAWNDKIKVDILVDTTLNEAYYFVDGKQIGGVSAYPIDEASGAFGDLRYYIQGDDATILFENCKYRVYDLKKEFDELYAEITGKKVYWTENGNTLDIEGDEIGMCLTAKNVFGAEAAVTGARLVVATYDAGNKLIGVELSDYESGVSNEEIVLEKTDDMTTIKAFCWGFPEYTPLSTVQIFNITDYIN